jgi:hypothetical protein
MGKFFRRSRSQSVSRITPGQTHPRLCGLFRLALIFSRVSLYDSPEQNPFTEENNGYR